MSPPVGMGFAFDQGMDRKKMMAELVKIQSEIDYQDITTISAYMSDAELAEHIARYAIKPARS